MLGIGCGVFPRTIPSTITLYGLILRDERATLGAANGGVRADGLRVGWWKGASAFDLERRINIQPDAKQYHQPKQEFAHRFIPENIIRALYE